MLVQTKSGNKLTGFYRGIVLKHLLRGKCKIWIPGVYPDDYKQDPDKLPDAEQASPIIFGYNNGNGVFSYPDINSTVWCFFANEDQNFPVYFASTLGSGPALDNFIACDPELDTKTGKEYPYISVLKYGMSKISINKAGQIWIDTSGKNGKNSIKINHDGTMEIINDGLLQITSKNVKFITNENFEMNAKNVMITATENISLNGQMSIQGKTDGTFQVKSKNSPSGKAL